MNDSFNKVFIGSGLLAEIFLHALIRHKGESPNDFYILSKKVDRCNHLMHKYQIKATTNFDAFISKAKVVVITVDISDLDDIPASVELIRDKVPPDALINSITPKLSIKQIEEYFPNHPVMRLSLIASAISGNNIGMYCCGSVNPADTAPVARFLIESIGELIEVKNEEEFEKLFDVMFAQNCSNYLAINCFIDSMINIGLTPKQALKISSAIYRGVGNTFASKYNDDILIRMFDFKEVFDKGLEIMNELGMAEALRNVHKLTPEGIKSNLELIRNDSLKEEKFEFHYKNLTN